MVHSAPLFFNDLSASSKHFFSRFAFWNNYLAVYYCSLILMLLCLGISKIQEELTLLE